MRSISFIRSALVAALALPLSAVVANAEEAAATTNLNVRSGPSTGFSVVDTLYPGEVVDMTECQSSGWCYITHDGPDGWVSSTYLTAGPGSGSADPGCRFELRLTGDGPVFAIVCGGGGGGGGSDPAPDPAPDEARACFYDLANYTGAAFCRGPVVLNSLPPDADDHITSVLLSGPAEVRLCQDVNLGGFCRTVTTSEGELGGLLNNRVSSLQVFAGSAPPPPPSGNRACFYDLPNFAGEHFCRGPMTLNDLPVDADDRITPVQITGAVHVRLCRNDDLGGFCRILTGSENQLGGALNNQVSSLRVFLP